jgi:hypothetical protein
MSREEGGEERRGWMLEPEKLVKKMALRLKRKLRCCFSAFP